MIKVAVIIVTYQGSRFIDGCFGALAKMRRDGMDVQVIAVDNGSTDDSVAQLKTYPFVTLIETGKNLGFAGGNDVGMQRAIDAGCEFVYLLNHDTEAEPDFLVEAVAAARAGVRVAAVQSLLLLDPDRQLVNSTGNAIHFLGFGYCVGYRTPAASVPKDGTPEIAYASGAGVLLRVSALKAVGLFDETFFMYHEDLDLGLRIRLAGMRSVLAPRSVVFHKYEFSRSISKYYYMERNRWIVLLSRFRAGTIAVLLIPLLGAEAGLCLAALRGGWLHEKLRTYAYFLQPSSWRHIATLRAETARIRTVPDSAIVSRFSSIISYQEVSGPFTRYVANPLMRACWGILKPFIV